MEYTKEKVLSLIKEKENVEQNIREFWDILKTNNVGMNDPLIDHEGYPRSDIDVYQVRHARHQIKCLQNDHTALLKQIEVGLVTVHSQARTAEADPNGVNVPPPLPTLEPFAKVDHVTLGSPAHIAGLQEGDQIAKFGSIVSSNFRNMTNIAEIVNHSVNSTIQVIVQREDQNVTLSLTPRTWSGRGLLGCNIVPIERLDR
ncbi:26S proteasome non-ATPase regulatory subunit 9-like [Penaeus japonicus]|uniref:26S proteasome non-ATPase regulatory subunit 9-like n=1 Tax=Penaeus japonicus TaxID=27405 RepID=UPI001C71482F|nr:26S proteasome non-ATPase regulatory subunit 9-like [Penaeus japonicus]